MYPTFSVEYFIKVDPVLYKDAWQDRAMDIKDSIPVAEIDV